MAGARVDRLPGALAPELCDRWRAAAGAREGGSLLLADVIALDDVLRALAPLRAAIAARLGSASRVVERQCWLRRAQPPHHWHQDGALHHDFAAPAAPLPMLTCWIPLVDCGVDAPGLEWIDAALDALLDPPALTDGAVAARFGTGVRPAFAAGTALLFDGALLHRTHATPAMARRRTSVELRFVGAGAPPARLAHEPLRAFA